jgi:hypothetical protein
MLRLNSNGTVVISRGDSADIPLFINQGTKVCPIRYVLSNNDRLYLGIMEPNQKFEDALIRKVYTRSNLNDFGDVVVKIYPEDTVNLIPGKYFYEAKLSYVDNSGENIINTIITKTEFYIED